MPPSSSPSPTSSPPPEIFGFRIYFLTLLCCLGAWMLGYNNGVIGGVLVLPAFHKDFNLPHPGSPSYSAVIGNIASMVQIGGLLGSMATFPLMKRKGRKICMGVGPAVYALGAGLQTFSNGHLGTMYAGRLIVGMGTGCITVVVPLYIAEIAPPSIRGSLVGLYEINSQLSSLTAYWCNYIVKLHIPDTYSSQWRIPLSMQLIPSVLLLLASLFLIPESPRFLLKYGKVEEARAVLAYIRNLPSEHDYIEGEMREIEKAVGRQALIGEGSALDCEGSKGVEKKGKWYKCQGIDFGVARELWWKGNRERVVIGLCLMFGQNLTGTVALNFYLATIFRSIGMRGTNHILFASGFFGVVRCVFTLTALAIFIDRLGRRLLLIIASVGSAFALWYIGAYIMIAKVDLMSPVEGISTQGWVAVAMVYVYTAFYSIAWNGVVWVYCAEIFPTRIKELAVCLTTAAQWLSQYLVARASPFMLSNLKGGFFFFFAACITLMGFGIYFFVPETKGRTLEEMDDVFGSPYKSRAGLEGGEAEKERDGGRGVATPLKDIEEEELEIEEKGMNVVCVTISQKDDKEAY